MNLKKVGQHWNKNFEPYIFNRLHIMNNIVFAYFLFPNESHIEYKFNWLCSVWGIGIHQVVDEQKLHQSYINSYTRTLIFFLNDLANYLFSSPYFLFLCPWKTLSINSKQENRKVKFLISFWVMSNYDKQKKHSAKKG